MPIRVKIKNFIKKLLPNSLFLCVLSIWRKTGSRFFTVAQLHDKYLEIFKNKHKSSVIAGPFQGLKYVETAAGSTLLLKLIGCYEEVLHPVIEELKKHDLKTIIDIGCAEGYYLVGLGMAMPQSRLIGFDIDPEAIKLTKELAAINGIKNELILLPNCTPDNLNDYITQDTLLICDAEGFELEILNPANTPKLATATYLLIELHEFAAPGVTEILKDRFAATHTIETITFKPVEATAYEFTAGINPKHAYEILRERGEQEQQWLFLTKKLSS